MPFGNSASILNPTNPFSLGDDLIALFEPYDIFSPTVRQIPLSSMGLALGAERTGNAGFRKDDFLGCSVVFALVLHLAFGLNYFYWILIIVLLSKINGTLSSQNGLGLGHPINHLKGGFLKGNLTLLSLKIACFSSKKENVFKVGKKTPRKSRGL